MLPPAQPEEPAPPGKIRTWWHPLLVNLLRWQLGEHYRLEEEVSVGIKPLQIDILLLRKEQGELSAHARAILSGLVERLGVLTLIEFKSPLDTLEARPAQVPGLRVALSGPERFGSRSRTNAPCGFGPQTDRTLS